MRKYFLSSLESRKLEPVRECEYLKPIMFDTGKNAVIIRLNEPLQWENEDGFHESYYAIITARHEGYDVLNIVKFPTFVYVTVLKKNNYEDIDGIAKDDLIIIGIGEIYETYEKALNHIFD